MAIPSGISELRLSIDSTQNVLDKVQTIPWATGSALRVLLLGQAREGVGHFDLRARGQRGSQVLPPACAFI